jgi:hypothetical protein
MFQVVRPATTDHHSVASWLSNEMRATMIVRDIILGCTGFIGVATQRGFSVGGTGFFVEIEEDAQVFGYLVSAAHVVWPHRTKDKNPPAGEDGKVDIRVNTKSGELPKPWSTKRSDFDMMADDRL